MSEIELHQSAAKADLATQMDFARVVSEGSLLPDAYRGKPANVMIAVGLGQSMGLSPAESLYRIAVINGKPTAGAELIAANVRKAGHKLRVRVSEDPPSCTAQVIRADDPDFPFEVTRDLAWAQRMGLANNPNYKKQPSTMLQWRAISAVARLACPEALYGVQYTPDEMGDMPAVTSPAPAATGGLAAALQSSGAEAAPEQSGPVEPTPTSAPESDPEPPITKAQLKKLHTVLTNLGIERDEGLAFYASHGAPVESSKDLTKEQARRIIDALEAIEEQPFDGGEGGGNA